jgi:hypothetical protein
VPLTVADAVALLNYLVDSFPRRADQRLAEAEAGETVIQAPRTALAEVLYAVAHDTDVRSIILTGTPEATRQALVGEGPITLTPVDDAELVEYTKVVDECSSHDGMIVASHRARETDAVITTDGAIRDCGIETVWE